jgi:hypothetical protein
MIFTNSKNGSFDNFVLLLNNATNYLNQDALLREQFYKDKAGTKLEYEIYNILNQLSIQTEFKGKIKLISGLKFPDITVNDIYGVEVKTSQGSTWETLGNSVVEGNRIPNITNIFLLFAKLSTPIQFICKLYQDCLSDIRVTHSPRYQINMLLNKNDTFFF